MESVHLHAPTAEGNEIHVGNICYAGPLKYQAAVHTKGARSWEPIGPASRSFKVALRRAADAIADDRVRYRRYNRAGVWAIEQGESYYDPQQVTEIRAY